MAASAAVEEAEIWLGKCELEAVRGADDNRAPTSLLPISFGRLGGGGGIMAASISEEDKRLSGCF